MNTVTLWHGGRDLKYNYKEITPAKGLWEHGPGLYLTTSYLRAKDYAKGGGNTFKVEIEEGNDIANMAIPIGRVEEFIASHIIKSKRNSLLEDVHNNMKRMKSTSEIKAEYFLNLVINLEALKKSNTDKLCQFLVENHVDYGFTHRYGGADETVMVIYNRQKIKKVQAVASKDVSEYEMECIFKPKGLYEHL